MMEQCVDQCAVEISRRRMDDEAGGLVDHDQMLVLEHDPQRDILRHIVGRCGMGDAYREDRTWQHLYGRIAQDI